jgi:hypothetical protein
MVAVAKVPKLEQLFPTKTGMVSEQLILDVTTQ